MKKMMVLLVSLVLSFLGFATECSAAYATTGNNSTATNWVLGIVAFIALCVIAKMIDTHLHVKFDYGLFQGSFLWAFAGVVAFFVAVFFPSTRNTCVLIMITCAGAQFYINIKEMDVPYGVSVSLFQIFCLGVTGAAFIILSILYFFLWGAAGGDTDDRKKY